MQIAVDAREREVVNIIRATASGAHPVVLWKSKKAKLQCVVLLQTFYNFARPHRRLRLPLPAQAAHASGLIQPNLCDAR